MEFLLVDEDSEYKYYEAHLGQIKVLSFCENIKTAYIYIDICFYNFKEVISQSYSITPAHSLITEVESLLGTVKWVESYKNERTCHWDCYVGEFLLCRLVESYIKYPHIIVVPIYFDNYIELVPHTETHKGIDSLKKFIEDLIK